MDVSILQIQALNLKTMRVIQALDFSEECKCESAQDNLK